MEKIASFTVDHTTLLPGMYVSRVDGDVTTFDLRFIKPNTPPYLEMAAVHTIEHLVATFVRNSEWRDNIIYFGPMGCRTGFYFLTRDLPREKALRLIQEALAFTAAFKGDIPGVSEPECGNWLEHDLAGARSYAAEMAKVLRDWTPNRMDYEAN